MCIYYGGNVYIPLLWKQHFQWGSQRHCSSQHIWTSTRMMGWCGPPCCCLVLFHLFVLCWGNDCVIDFLYLLPVTVLDDDCQNVITNTAKFCLVLSFLCLQLIPVSAYTTMTVSEFSCLYMFQKLHHFNPEVLAWLQLPQQLCSWVPK